PAGPVAVAETRPTRRPADGPEDGLVSALVRAARLLVEAPSGRQLIEQSWRLVLDRWPARRTLLLPLSPLIRIERIRVYDAAGSASDVAAPLYRAERGRDPPRVALEPGAPEPGRLMDGIEIDLI